MAKESFYITTTLPYVNAPLHMGHALEFVRADTIARYKKLAGLDVFFNTGTDEHGMKNYEKAKEKKMAVQDFVDKGFETFKEQIKMFGVSDDVHFVRTTDPHHKMAAQEFWKRVDKNGYIYKKAYQAKYCVGCESEKTDSELNEKGECLLHPGRTLELINEENYFFKFSQFGEKLLEFYEKNPNFVIPDFRLNEMKNFITAGLQDFSISRLKSKMPWGVEVPGDSEHVMYVWFDALTNYISTLGWPACAEASAGKPDHQCGQDSPEMCTFSRYWVKGNPTQYCGKDNTRFQAVTWQAMLMAAGVPNSHQIVVNGFITADGGLRMSKTVGNVVDPRDIVKEYGTDALRYFLLREVSSFEDSPFTPERFRDAYNSGLANGLGNLVSRVMTMAVNNNIKAREVELKIFEGEYKIDPLLEKYQINNAMNRIWGWVSEADMLIQVKQPFKLIKDNFKGAEIEIQTLLNYLTQISFALRPFLPETSEKIEELIKSNKKPEQPLFLRKE